MKPWALMRERGPGILTDSSGDFLAREGGREVHEVGGLMRLLHSCTKRLLQHDDSLAREGGRGVHETGGVWDVWDLELLWGFGFGGAAA